MFLPCPHCGIMIEIVAVNCGTYRCGIYRDTGEQIHPHLSEAEALTLSPIWGCSKPFKLHNGKLIMCAWTE